MYKELRQLIKKFAKTNGVRMDHDYLIEKEVEDSKAKSGKNSKITEPSKMDFLRQPEIFMNLAVVIV